METHPVAQMLSRFWWLLLLRGIASILFGISAFAWPGLTLVTLTILFASYALIDGVFDVIHAVSHRKELEHWGLIFLEGLFGIIFGSLALLNPEVASVAGGIVVGLYIAAWAIVTGVLRIVLAIRLRKEIEGELMLGLCGAASIAMGIVIMAFPMAGALGLLYLLGAWALFLGIVQVAFALKSRNFGRKIAAALTSAE